MAQDYVAPRMALTPWFSTSNPLKYIFIYSRVKGSIKQRLIFPLRHMLCIFLIYHFTTLRYR